MIRVNDDLAPQDVWPKLLESVNHRQKLFIRSRIVNLSFDEGLTCIADGCRLLVKSLPQGCLTSRFRASLKHKDNGQTKFIKPNS